MRGIWKDADYLKAQAIWKLKAKRIRKTQGGRQKAKGEGYSTAKDY
jgi:hypothetical protein